MNDIYKLRDYRNVFNFGNLLNFQYFYAVVSLRVPCIGTDLFYKTDVNVYLDVLRAAHS